MIIATAVIAVIATAAAAAAACVALRLSRLAQSAIQIAYRVTCQPVVDDAELLALASATHEQHERVATTDELATVRQRKGRS